MFCILCVVYVHDDDDVDDDNDDVVKQSATQFHGTMELVFTSPFHSTVKPIPRCTWRLVRETNSTAP